MKRLLTLLLVVGVSFSAMADEGMWLLPYIKKMNEKDMKAHGAKLKAEDIYSAEKSSLKDAIVIFGGGCTGEIVSPEGLIFTNHHCGYGAIQQLSSVEHDYLADGFWATCNADELPAEGLSVRFVRHIWDVTADIVGNIPSTASEQEFQAMVSANKQAKIAELKAKYPGYDIIIPGFFGNNQFFAFAHETYTDVRLVGTPPSSIGKFGGDTDNWIWPRHTGDFTVFRVYADKDNKPADFSRENVPYKPRRHFKISTKGVEEGDFTMIYGFPGNTQRYVISSAADYVERLSDPMKIKLRTLRLDVISKAQEADPKVRIQYAAKRANIANAWKKWQGEVLGLERLGTVEKKRAYEQKFAAWAESKPEYKGLLEKMYAAYDELRDPYWRAEYFAESISAIELAQLTRMVAQRKPAPDDKQVAAFYKNYVADIDREVAKKLVAAFVEDIDAQYIPESVKSEMARFASTDHFVDYLFDESQLTTPEKFEALASDPAHLPSIMENDPMNKFVTELIKCGNFSQRRYRNMSDAPSIAQYYAPYMRALMEYDKQMAFFPDANLTLRVAYGKVGGYRYADAVYHKHYTTLDGIIEKDDPNIYDYDIPQALRDIYAAKDYGRWGIEMDGRYTVPVCFIASNHTTGGNSGSPVLNGRGELIGINFDRTWLSTMSDIEFDPEICRNIAVDIRYVLFVIDRIGGAGYLLDEMELK